MENDNVDSNNSVEPLTDDLFINFSPEVQKAIEEILTTSPQQQPEEKDPLDDSNFNCIDYINQLFPTEQSLTNLDETIIKMENKINRIDNNISLLINEQIARNSDGYMAIDESQKIIKQLFLYIKAIKERAEKSEEMVREITHDIKQLDCAKKNLTLSITTLNHLNMLVSGVDNMKQLQQKRRYNEILLPLQAICEVMQYFENYNDIDYIKNLYEQVQTIQYELGEQILTEFKDIFGNNNTTFTTITTNIKQQLAQALNIITILDNKYKQDLIKWFINLQLQEYKHLFDITEDISWLDKIDRRYTWLKKHLLEFEQHLLDIFPNNWEISERIAVEFCFITQQQLTTIMLKRKQEIDCKLLLYAIQKTTTFENLLIKRFTGITLLDNKFVSNSDKMQEPSDLFHGIIGRCFIPHLTIYIDSIDKNLSDLIQRFVQDDKQAPHAFSNSDNSNHTMILSSCPDLFVFYKKSLIQCQQLDNGPTLLDLTKIFKKFLYEYCDKLLLNNLPKLESSSSSSLTAASLTTSSVIQNFSSLLKDGDLIRLNKNDLNKICCILLTGEYCLETTQQLSDKLKEKICPQFIDQIDLTKEQDHFHKVISNCIQILVQDLENACEPALTAMTKIQWQNIDAVGDQSPYITSIIANLKQTIPIIRENLINSRKYFIQYCIKFINQFIPKFLSTIYKCKPINTEGAEQLLLDTHMLKTILLNLPSIESNINRQPPISYTKLVVKHITKAEMILKIVMTPIDPTKYFIEQYRKLLPDCQLNDLCKILDMKNVKRQEQAVLIDVFKNYKN